jgi:hypothetical protein
MPRLRYYESHFSHKEVNNMRLTRNLGMILLAIWLILTGLMQLVSIALPVVVMAVLAIAAGVLILLGR